MVNNDITEFILLGLTQDPRRQKIIFVIFFIVYVGTLVGNLLIIVMIEFSRTLGSLMYFIFHLSVSDTYFSTSIAPRLIVDALSTKNIISYNECMTQVFALNIFGCMIFVLILIAVDHYVAICKSLYYPIIMRCQVCIFLMFLHSMAQTILALRLPFCGPNLIDHSCCDLQPLPKLACMNTYAINLLLVSNSGAIRLSSFVILVISYFVILNSLRHHSAEGKKIALSTCTSHIIVVILFFDPCIFIHTCPPTTFPMDKMVTVFYTIGTSFLNPLIYTPRNAEVKHALRRAWYVKITSESKR